LIQIRSIEGDLMRAAIYVRVSTVEQAQEGYSIPAQIAILRDLAKTYNYKIIKIYQDAGISGKNIKDRPDMCRLIEDAEQKKFDVVLVWKLSRLSRSLLDLLSIVDIFTQNSVAFQSYSEKFDTSTPMGKMLLQMLGSIAEFERNTIAENVKMGLNERFKQGYSKGAIPFGYKSIDKRAIIAPEQAEVVKRVFETYLNGDDDGCLTHLAEQLNADDFRTRTGGLWGRIALRDMLKNSFYMGYVKTGIHSRGYEIKENAEVKKGAHEPIIPEDIFNKVNQKLEALKRNNIVRYPDNDSVLTGLVVCPRCGSKMFALNSTNKHVKKSGEVSIYPVNVYRCNSSGYGKGICKGFYVTANKIQPQAILALADYINNRKYNIKVSDKPRSAPTDNELKLVESELKQTISIRDKYFRLFESDKVDMELFSDKINGILAKINSLERKKEEILSKTVPNKDIDYSKMFSRINNFNDIYDNLSNRDKKEFLRQFIKSVHITVDKLVDKVELINGHTINLLS